MEDRSAKRRERYRQRRRDDPDFCNKKLERQRSATKALASDPVKKAARNAKRRERYKQQMSDGEKKHQLQMRRNLYHQQAMAKPGGRAKRQKRQRELYREKHPLKEVDLETREKWRKFRRRHAKHEKMNITCTCVFWVNMGDCSQAFRPSDICGAR